jgi:hypothetical protein
MSYLNAGGESPVEAALNDGSLPLDGGIDTGQSGEDGEGVATPTEPEQPTEADETEIKPTTPADGQSEELETLTRAELEELRTAKQQRDAVNAYIAQQQEAARESERRERYVNGFNHLTEADEEDVPTLAENLIGEIQRDTTEQVEAIWQERVGNEISLRRNMEHGFMALIGAVQSQPQEVLDAIQKDAEALRNKGETPEDIHRTFEMEREFRARESEQVKELRLQVEQLTAQVAGQGLVNSGVYNAGGSGVGSVPPSEAKTMDEYLSGRL